MADDEENAPPEAPVEASPEEQSPAPAAEPPQEPEPPATEEPPTPPPEEPKPPTKDEELVREESKSKEIPKPLEAARPPPAPEKKEAAPPLPSEIKEDKRKSADTDTEMLMPTVVTPQRSKRASMRDATTPATRRSKMQGSSKAKLVLGSIVDIKSTVQSEYFGTSKTGDMRDTLSLPFNLGDVIVFSETADAVPRYANSYRLDSENPFNHEKVEKILKEVLVETLENLTYDPERCAAQAKNASKNIRQKVKQLEFDRYKIVCMVTIGEKNSQDVFVTCRGLWDVEKDRYATYAMENTYVYAIGYCFGFYYE